MKILVFTHNAWDDTNALGNTLSNLFCGKIWKNDEFYNIYMRNNMPNNNVCHNYYRITINEIIKNTFSKEKIGERFTYEKSSINSKNIINKKEQKIIDTIHRHSLNFVYLIADYFYRKKGWLNNNFKKNIDDIKPDIFFSFVTGVAMLKPVIEYIKENTNAKIILFIADDVYGSYQNASFFRRRKLKKDFTEILNMADYLYGASNELCLAYGELFKKQIVPLYKGCSFNFQDKKSVNNIIKFVYAGNLFYGRIAVLSKLAEAIDKSNRTSSTKAILEIYTGATISEDINNKLNIPNSSIIKGKREYEEIKEIESEADYVLHVESFEQDNIDYVKYSFSTKIIDCLQSGSCLVGIGPSSIASMKYIASIPGAHFINEIEKIDDFVKELIENKNMIIDDSNKIRAFAIKNHKIEDNQKRLRNNFENQTNNNRGVII